MEHFPFWWLTESYLYLQHICFGHPVVGTMLSYNKHVEPWSERILSLLLMLRWCQIDFWQPASGVLVIHSHCLKARKHGKKNSWISMQWKGTYKEAKYCVLHISILCAVFYSTEMWRIFVNILFRTSKVLNKWKYSVGRIPVGLAQCALNTNCIDEIRKTRPLHSSMSKWLIWRLSPVETRCLIWLLHKDKYLSA